MQRVGGGDAVGASQLASSRFSVVGVLLLGLAVAGCSTAAHFPGTLSDARGAAIAFESIEGPPPHLVHRIVRDLTEEAAARQIAVVARGGPAAYRIRGYLAAHAEQGTTSIAWAWDIYDAGQRRAFRLTGEDKTTGGRKSWAAADAQALRRIARASMDQLVVFMAGARTPAAPVPDGAPAAPQRGPSIIAGLDDFRPEAAGILAPEIGSST